MKIHSWKTRFNFSLLLPLHDKNGTIKNVARGIFHAKHNNNDGDDVPLGDDNKKKEKRGVLLVLFM